MTDVLLVVNVDSDPDPVSTYQEDSSVLAKYSRMRDNMKLRRPLA